MTRSRFTGAGTGDISVSGTPTHLYHPVPPPRVILCDLCQGAGRRWIGEKLQLFKYDDCDSCEGTGVQPVPFSEVEG